MKTRRILSALLFLAALAFTGCETVSVQKRTMKLTTPLFSYESETQGFAGSKEAAGNLVAPPDSASAAEAK